MLDERYGKGFSAQEDRFMGASGKGSMTQVRRVKGNIAAQNYTKARQNIYSDTKSEESNNEELNENKDLRSNTETQKIIEELKAIQTKFESSNHLMSRMDKLTLNSHMVEEALAKIQQSLSSVRSDVEELHKINGGNFGNVISSMESKMNTLEASFTDMGREQRKEKDEFKRLISAQEQALSDYTKRMESDLGATKKIYDAMESELKNKKGEADENSKRNQLDMRQIKEELEKQRHETQELRAWIEERVQVLYEHDIEIDAQTVCDLALYSQKQDKLDEVVPAGSNVKLRYPERKVGDLICMSYVRVDENANIKRFLLPVEQNGERVIIFQNANAKTKAS